MDGVVTPLLPETNALRAELTVSGEWASQNVQAARCINEYHFDDAGVPHSLKTVGGNPRLTSSPRHGAINWLGSTAQSVDRRTWNLTSSILRERREIAKLLRDYDSKRE